MKELLIKCIKHLNNLPDYNNISYGVTKYCSSESNPFINISFIIWINDTTVHKCFTYNIESEEDFEVMTKALEEFIIENKEIIW